MQYGSDLLGHAGGDLQSLLPRQDPSFDYRYGAKYPKANRQVKHSADSSVLTFKGHSVYSTLIRCQFSPSETTDQRYVYSGSSDGNIYIYDLVTGDTASILRRSLNEPADEQFDFFGQVRRNGAMGANGGSPTRDISWHPF